MPLISVTNGRESELSVSVVLREALWAYIEYKRIFFFFLESGRICCIEAHGDIYSVQGEP